MMPSPSQVNSSTKLFLTVFNSTSDSLRSKILKIWMRKEKMRKKKRNQKKMKFLQRK